ncbi:MAG: caspase family protein [Hyphomonas sp.]|uniref:caspase family protein n=1 Tax=Hyphomonas sp. TaxID=87 RepID=UPI003299930E
MRLRALFCFWLTLSAGLLCGAAGRADVYALIIGIDRYKSITPLRGAVNDAMDISDAMAKLNPAEVVVLIDEQASRDAILNTWSRFSTQAKSGDTIVVTFAGHGSNEIAAYEGTEADGRDETFLLAGFSPTGVNSGERIRDDEIAALIALRPDVRHVIVADSCHSGTATRSTPFDIGYRFYSHGELVDDPLPPPPPVSGTDQIIAENSTVFSAVSDDEKAPEIGIDGQIRGALSFAFAQGLRGQADRDADGVITKGEMETHVRRYVKLALNGRQKPQVSPPGQLSRPLFEYGEAEEPPAPASAFRVPYQGLPSLQVRIEGGDLYALNVTELSGAVQSFSQANADLVIDFVRQEIRTGNGDSLRQLTREVNFNWRAQIQKTVDKMRVVKGLTTGVLSSELEVSFPYGDELYFDDDMIRILITGRTHRHLTVINLSPTGAIQWLYPRYSPLDNTLGLEDPKELGLSELLQFDAYVTPPFGAEHIIVIETPTPHNPVRRAAMRFDGSDFYPEFWEDLHQALRYTEHSVGLHAFFTRDRQDQ